MHDLIHRRLANPDVDPKLVYVLSMAISGLIDGAVVGAVFTDEDWWNGAWKGALAGGAVVGSLALLLSALSDEPQESTFKQVCDPSLSDALGAMASSGVRAGIAGAAAGAAIAAPGQRARRTGEAALWAASVYAVGQGAVQLTRKLAPTPQCRAIAS